MYEYFTNDAKRMITIAETEALDMGHKFLTTEHMALAFVAADFPMTKILSKVYNINYEKFKDIADKAAQRHIHYSKFGRMVNKLSRENEEQYFPPKLPLTSMMKKAILLANEQSGFLNNDFEERYKTKFERKVDTGHLLLGALLGSDGVLPGIFKKLKIDIGELVEVIIFLLNPMEKTSDFNFIVQEIEDRIQARRCSEIYHTGIICPLVKAHQGKEEYASV